ncbi:TPM domain-containing protein [Corynebacterium breve]|uniref:TPM domain-containing protein n=1 Tax=Corynebacterium breve TaxID=3049799 RepID=A0ABY8VD90_9CORY|nr:TPM domain-containing protein [Corynebacterium breve]WIM67072.1 TPM domain-containing protein [Corynebacterium breve]
MTAQHFKALLAAPLLGGAVALACAPAALALTSDVTVQAQAQATMEPVRLTTAVTDASGILSATDIAAIEDAIDQLRSERQLNAYVVYMPSFGDYQPTEWAEKAVAANGGDNTAVIAISPEERLYGIHVGSQWTQAQLDDMNEAAFSSLSNDDWADAAVNALQAATPGGSSGENATWLGAGAGAVALTGGGLWAYSRRKNKKESAAMLESSRDIDPADTRSLAKLPTQTLEQLAQDTLVAVDESIRLGREELDLATAEFGPDRTRSFTAAMNTANSAMQRAFEIQKRLNDAIPETEPEKRSMLVDIISSAGTADQALDRKSEEFSEMRNLLITAPDAIDQITQRTVSIRTRIEPAREILKDLQSRYSDAMLDSIEDNVELAVASLQEAENNLDSARELESRPAGQQGALVDHIRTGEHSVEVADNLLRSIENADANIRNAQANLPALIEEIEGEIVETERLKAATQSGARINVSTLNDVAHRARYALQEARAIANQDPLKAFTDLTHTDAELDEAIADAQGAARDQERQLSILDQQLNAAAAQIQGAEDLIASYGRVVGSQARTLLAEAKRQHADALNRRINDTRNAIELARMATESARRAARAAQNDINNYRNRQAAGTFGDIAQGIIIGSMLSGGGGSRGGFGGGGFGGGGGGWGGGSRGGSF